MATQVKVPEAGESVSEAVLVKWFKSDGDSVAVDEPICELETDKANIDLPSPAAGALKRLKAEGETVKVGEVIAEIGDGAAAASKKETPKAEKQEPKEAAPAEAPKPKTLPPLKPTRKEKAEQPSADDKEKQKPQDPSEGDQRPAPPKPSPGQEQQPPPEQRSAAAEEEAPTEEKPAEPAGPPPVRPHSEGVRRVAMSKIRRRIAERLVRAQQTAAMLTTFNEIDMTAVMDARARHQERFTKAHGVPLGIMSFFARASVVALRQFPILNAELDGDDIVYHDHVHLGVAVSTDRGLVVPVLRNVESMSLARIEGEIKRVATAARDGKLSLQELSGGTFTITNGGVFGSLLSTPILNPPQTGILGLHTIQKRPMVVGERIRARPMMYVALTYDHRLVDGREAVLFLVRLKELIEDPTAMVIES